MVRSMAAGRQTWCWRNIESSPSWSAGSRSSCVPHWASLEWRKPQNTPHGVILPPPRPHLLIVPLPIGGVFQSTPGCLYQTGLWLSPKYLLWIFSSTSLLHLTLNCSYFLKSRFNIIYKYGCVWPAYVSVLNLCVCMCITYVCFCMFVCVTCVCICVYVKCVWTVYVCIYLWTMYKCAWPVCMWVCTGGREEQRVLCVYPFMNQKRISDSLEL